MTKGQRTIATLLVLVAALLGGIVIVQTSSPAEAGTAAGGAASGVGGGGACPSDVTGDGVVNVLDLIDLLLDFGAECPGPQLVGVAAIDPSGRQTIVRIWSDGFAEYKVSILSKAFEPQVWTPLLVNPDAPLSRPVALGGKAGATIWRLWADGTADSLRFAAFDDSVVPGLEGWITEPN